MSLLGLGAAGSTVATFTSIGAAAVGGAVVAGVFAVAGTQVAASITQPSETSANLKDVNAPSYAK